MEGRLPEAGADLSAYRDADAVTAFAEPAVRWAVARGLLRGTGGGALEPEGGLTRAQWAAVLHRWLT